MQHTSFDGLVAAGRLPQPHRAGTAVCAFPGEPSRPEGPTIAVAPETTPAINVIATMPHQRAYMGVLRFPDLVPIAEFLGHAPRPAPERSIRVVPVDPARGFAQNRVCHSDGYCIINEIFGLAKGSP